MRRCRATRVPRMRRSDGDQPVATTMSDEGYSGCSGAPSGCTRPVGAARVRGQLIVTSFVLGIDVGTSYTAAAIGRRRPTALWRSNRWNSVHARPQCRPSCTSATTVSVLVGEAAERRAIDQPERVVREFKRRIGDETPIIVGDLSVAAEDIFAVARAVGRRSRRAARGRAAGRHRAVASRDVGRASPRPDPDRPRRRRARRRRTRERTRGGRTPLPRPARRSTPAQRSPSTTWAAARSTSPSSGSRRTTPSA